MMKNKIMIWVFLIVIFIGIIWIWKYLNSINVSKDTFVKVSWISQNFLKDNLKTNTSKSSIDLDLILDGWPWKDGIPAINEPKFIKIHEERTQKWLSDEILWLSLNDGGNQKFYPYSILYWHEIVNDILWNKEILVTFCPLCGTAIVYDRNINGETRKFGVSWKLYESNLLMYDNKNESLWSQSIGEAVVWEDLWKTLEVIKSDLISYSQFKKNYPNWLILSEETGYSRSYSRTPYGDYETEEDLYFPVQNTDKKLHQKELMFVLPYNWDSYVFMRSELMSVWELNYSIWMEDLNIVHNNWEITAKIWDKIIPWYIEMWFSWVTQHPWNNNIWIGE